MQKWTQRGPERLLVFTARQISLLAFIACSPGSFCSLLGAKEAYVHSSGDLGRGWGEVAVDFQWFMILKQIQVTGPGL